MNKKGKSDLFLYGIYEINWDTTSLSFTRVIFSSIDWAPLYIYYICILSFIGNCFESRMQDNTLIIITFDFRVSATPVLPYRRQTETRRWVCLRLSRCNQECLHGHERKREESVCSMHVYSMRARNHAGDNSCLLLANVYCTSAASIGSSLLNLRRVSCLTT